MTVPYIGGDVGVSGISNMKRLYSYGDKIYAWNGERIYVLSGDEMISVVECPTEPEFSTHSIDGLPCAWLTTPELLLHCGQRTEASVNYLKLSRIYALENTFFAIKYSTNLLYFSDLDPSEWESDELSYADVNGIGKLCSMSSHNGYLYIFGTYGIARVRYTGSRALIYTVYTSTEKIYPDTVCLRGERFYFCTENRVLSLDGSVVSEVYKYDSHAPLNTARASFFGNNYIVNLENGGLLSIDCSNKKYYASVNLGMSVFDVCECPNIERVACLTNEGAGVLSLSGKYYGKALRKTFFTEINLGDSLSVKRLNSMTLTTNSDIAVTFYIDNKEINKIIYAANTSQTINLNRAGKVFAIKLSSSSAQTEISNVCLEYEIMKRL